MKKISLLIISILIASILSLNVYAEDGIEVFVSVSNGNLCLSGEKINVRDIDNDGKITINDALYCAHQEKFEGGAEEGYESSMGAYGLKIDKLWGVNNGDAFGYYVNNSSAMSLGDTLKNGDRIYAFSYTDLNNFSDTFSYFETFSVTVKENEDLSLMLSTAGYDEMWNPISLPCKNAKITVDGKVTDLMTDDDGKVTISFEKKGKYVISAVSETQNLVPPVCLINVTKEIENATPADYSVYILALASISAIISIFFVNVLLKCSKRYEK